MHGKRGDPRVVREDDCTSVALVDVAIDDEHALQPSGLKEPFGRQGKVVEDAKPFGAVGVGVVGSAGDVHGHRACVKGSCGAIQGALHDHALAFHHGRRPRKAASPFLLPRPFALQRAAPILGVVGEQDGFLGHGGWLEEVGLRNDAFVQDLVFEEGILLHGKAVAFRNLQNIARCVGNVHS